jgi:hypothetical protein
MVCAFRVKQVGADTVQTRSLKLPQQAGSRVAGAYSPFQPSPITSIMPQTSLEVASHFNYQSIFDSALEEYKSKTGKDLTEDPLLRSLETCDTPDAVLTILRAQILGPGPSQSSHDKLTTWLDPTVNVINAFSATIGGGVGLVSPTRIEVIAPRSASDFYFEGLPTCWSDIYGHWSPAVSEYLHRSHFQGYDDVFDMILLRLLKMSALFEVNSLTSSHA